MSKPEFVYVTYIETTPEKLWHALTDAAFTKTFWFGYSLHSDWHVGSPMSLKSKDGQTMNECKVLESDPPRRLSYTWRAVFDSELAKEEPSRVTFDLEPKGHYVKLTVSHGDFPPGSLVLEGISGGWPMVLSSLKSILETGRPMPPDFVKVR